MKKLKTKGRCRASDLKKGDYFKFLKGSITYKVDGIEWLNNRSQVGVFYSARDKTHYSKVFVSNEQVLKRGF